MIVDTRRIPADWSQTAAGIEVSPLVHSVTAPAYAEPAYLCIQVGKI